MELRQLRYFIAVAEESNFTRAAERLRISQPGISAQIRQLEHDLGATLIDRSGRTASLTSAGEAVLSHARAALAAAEAARHAVAEVNGLLRGRLTVGMVTACTVTPLFDALASFHRAHPGVEITLAEHNSDELIEQVRGGVADLALIGTADEPPQGLEAMPIISERLVAAVPFGHPLAESARVTLDHISAYPIVSLPEGTGIRAVFDQGCAAQGIRPNIALQASAPSTVANLALRGLGVAVLSESMAAHYDGLETLVIDDIETLAVLSLVYNSGKSAALRELLAHCRHSFLTAPADRLVSVTAGLATG
ncbi:LysR family transcriptional regulator [Streptomyces sp. APSN-46.1]|uniref:LysR family transcriptional regulator n=1 Tax=Streptomyces sp. APSN-46.1 TaxID=2929049 RepID=UPI001FB43BC0|nr:LysR family transcriptional regulator [Streptomyces sp. APSN-46.1]MCJ1680431.1 LysR family transcriptional regulator [Streptomyces sp. APSN-46.1]